MGHRREFPFGRIGFGSLRLVCGAAFFFAPIFRSSIFQCQQRRNAAQDQRRSRNHDERWWWSHVSAVCYDAEPNRSFLLPSIELVCRWLCYCGTLALFGQRFSGTHGLRSEELLHEFGVAFDSWHFHKHVGRFFICWTYIKGKILRKLFAALTHFLLIQPPSEQKADIWVTKKHSKNSKGFKIGIEWIWSEHPWWWRFGYDKDEFDDASVNFNHFKFTTKIMVVELQFAEYFSSGKVIGRRCWIAVLIL